MLIVVCAASAFIADSDIAQYGFNAPPQWFGLVERINIYGFMLWMGVLAIVLLHVKKGQAQSTE